MPREDDLRAELAVLQESIVDTRPEDFIGALVFDQLCQRQAFVAEELRAAVNRELAIRFVDEANPAAHSLSTAVLGGLLTRFQTTLNYIRWAIEAGPGVHGEVPSGMVHSAATETVALSPGSFRVVLRKTDLELSTAFDEGIDLLLDVAECAHEILGDDAIDTRVADMGADAVSRLGKFFKRLASEGLTTEFRWQASVDRQVVVSAADAEYLAGWLSSAVADSQDLTVTGTLKMADSDTNRFAIEDGSGRRIEGRSEIDLAHAEIEGAYRADLLLVRYKSRLTAGEKERVILKALVRVANAPTA